MALEKFLKQPYETFGIEADFSQNFEQDEVVTSGGVTALDKEGSNATDVVLDTNSVTLSELKVSVNVKSGDPLLSPYKITFRCVTSVGNQWELDVSMKVKEL